VVAVLVWVEEASVLLASVVAEESVPLVEAAGATSLEVVEVVVEVVLEAASGLEPAMAVSPVTTTFESVVEVDEVLVEVEAASGLLPAMAVSPVTTTLESVVVEVL